MDTKEKLQMAIDALHYVAATCFIMQAEAEEEFSQRLFENFDAIIEEVKSKQN